MIPKAIFRPIAPKYTLLGGKMADILTSLLPQYLYLQYRDDMNVQAFVDAYNEYAQEYFDSFNGLEIQNYLNKSGSALDWVGQGLYGISRTTLATYSQNRNGAYNTTPYNTIPYNGGGVSSVFGTTYVVDDELYKRIITWHFFKGDGKTFTIRWLKRRVIRFLLGENGTFPTADQMQQVGVTFQANRVAVISVYRNQDTVFTSTPGDLFSAGNAPPGGIITKSDDALTYVDQFKSAIEGGVLELPLGYTFSVNIIE